MKSEDSGKVSRRKFVKAGLLTATALTVGFRSSIREVLAKARGVGKPLLTEGNFNKLIPEDANKFKRLALEAKQDLKAFIKKYFYLTDSQNRKLDSLTREEIKLVTSEIDKAVAGGYRIRVQFRRRPTKAAVMFVPIQQATDPNAPSICGSGPNASCVGHLCGCRSMTGNDFGGVIEYGDSCDIAG